MLTPESIQSEASAKEMIGSIFIIQAENIEAVRTIIVNDIYYTTEVVGSLLNLFVLFGAEMKMR